MNKNKSDFIYRTRFSKLVLILALIAFDQSTMAQLVSLSDDKFSWTSDAKFRLDWLDFDGGAAPSTIGRSYNAVSAEFGSGGSYEGWRYATQTEVNQFITSATGRTYAGDGWSTAYEGVMHQVERFVGRTYVTPGGPRVATWELRGITGDSFNPDNLHYRRTDLINQRGTRNDGKDFWGLAGSTTAGGVNSRVGSWLVRDSEFFETLPGMGSLSLYQPGDEGVFNLDMIDGDGNFVHSGAFDWDAPTMVVTHGWQPSGEFGDGNIPQSDLLQSVLSRLEDEDRNANILMYNWEGAYTDSGIGDASLLDSADSLANTNAAGIALGSMLEQVFTNTNYDSSQGIHLLGHSHGTAVNGFAASNLLTNGIAIDQFTILDAPMDSLSLASAGAIPSDFFNFFLDTPNGRPTIVENIYSSSKYAFGTPIKDIPSTEMVNATHEQVATLYGSDIVENDQIQGTAGYVSNPWVSPLLKPVSLLDPWAPEWESSTTLLANRVQWQIVTGNVFGESCALATWVECAAEDLLEFLHLKEASPVETLLEVLVPAGANLLTFQFGFQDVGDGDWISLFFNEEFIWNMSGEHLGAGNLSTAVIDISRFAGKEGAFRFKLNSVGDSQADFAFSEFRYTNSAVPEPSVLILLALGLAGLGFRRIRLS